MSVQAFLLPWYAAFLVFFSMFYLHCTILQLFASKVYYWLDPAYEGKHGPFLSEIVLLCLQLYILSLLIFLKILWFCIWGGQVSRQDFSVYSRLSWNLFGWLSWLRTQRSAFPSLQRAMIKGMHHHHLAPFTFFYVLNKIFAIFFAFFHNEM